MSKKHFYFLLCANILMVILAIVAFYTLLEAIKQSLFVDFGIILFIIACIFGTMIYQIMRLLRFNRRVKK